MRHFHLDDLPTAPQYSAGQYYRTCEAGSPRSNAYWSIVEPGKPAVEVPDFHESDQWLYVISGNGRAESGTEEPIALTAGSLLMIPARTRHVIVNTFSDPLVTVNVFTPPL